MTLTAPKRRGRTRGLCLMLVTVVLATVACTLPDPSMSRTGRLPAASGRAAIALACDGDLGPTDNTRLAAVQQMVNDGKFYAALAELDALNAQSNKATWLRAEALRRIERFADAQALYGSLVATCMEGRAQHGLGLTAARQGKGAEAIVALRRARQLLPTDAQVRNDFGYALLSERQWDDAQFEFLTALDLSPQDALASRNLVLLAFAQGKTTAARALATRFKLDQATTERLAAQAATWAAPLANLPTPAPREPAAPLPPLTSTASEAS